MSNWTSKLKTQYHLARKLKCFSINLTKHSQGLHKEIFKKNSAMRKQNLNKCEIFLFMS